MRCAQCKQPIKSDDTRREIERDAQGRPVGGWCGKCAHARAKRRDTVKRPFAGRANAHAPSAYDVTTRRREDLSPEAQERRARAEREYRALVERQARMARARAQDRDGSSPDETDWRDPDTLSLDEIIADREGEAIAGKHDLTK